MDIFRKSVMNNLSSMTPKQKSGKVPIVSY